MSIGDRGTGIIRDGIEVKFKLGFTNKNMPVLGIYEKESGVFIVQITLNREEVHYFRDYFIQF
jgi:hypothetical protein